MPFATAAEELTGPPKELKFHCGLQSDEAWRQEWCQRIGCGFPLIRLQNVVEIPVAEAA
jgi:hypothetical protein